MTTSEKSTHILAVSLAIGAAIAARGKRDWTVTSSLLAQRGVDAIYAITGHERLRILGRFTSPVAWALVLGRLIRIGLVLRELLREDEPIPASECAQAPDAGSA